MEQYGFLNEHRSLWTYEMPSQRRLNDLARDSASKGLSCCPVSAVPGKIMGAFGANDYCGKDFPGWE
jgi:hypothetical protein